MFARCLKQKFGMVHNHVSEHSSQGLARVPTREKQHSARREAETEVAVVKPALVKAITANNHLT